MTDNQLYTKKDDVKFTDVIDLFCQFSDKLELAANEPSYGFLTRRMDFFDEESGELYDAIGEKDDVEILDGAIDTAFVALTQAYHLFRMRGFHHHQAVAKVRGAMMEVGKTNMTKNVPTEKGAKITKPANWKEPALDELLMTAEEIMKKRGKERIL